MTFETGTATDAATGARPSLLDRLAAPVLDRWLLERLHEGTGRPPVQFALEGGPAAGPPVAESIGRIVFRDRGTLIRVVADPDLAFGEAYAEERAEVEGDLVPVLEALNDAARRAPASPVVRLGSWLARSRANGVERARANARHHYDVGNDFYRLWLDERMVYTCAYFRSPGATLEDAQVAKMEHVCRKLRLAPGDRVVEAGCGWGALALHMAARHGASVTAYNVSREQVAWARERAKEAGLADRVEFVEDDWRAIRGRFDAFVSVGMLEHVGLAHYEELGAVIDRSLEASGRGLLHFIGRNRSLPMNRWIERHIFPGSHAPTIAEAMRVLEPFELSVLDVENLRLHYARTLEHWLERYERAASPIEARHGARFARTWRLYLAGSIAAFRTGWLQLFQVLFARPRKDDLPLTRAHLTAGDPPGDSTWNAATR